MQEVDDKVIVQWLRTNGLKNVAKHVVYKKAYQKLLSRVFNDRKELTEQETKTLYILDNILGRLVLNRINSKSVYYFVHLNPDLMNLAKSFDRFFKERINFPKNDVDQTKDNAK